MPKETLPSLLEAYSTEGIAPLNRLAELNPYNPVEFQLEIGGVPHSFVLRGMKADMHVWRQVIFGLWEKQPPTPTQPVTQELPVARAVYHCQSKTAELSATGPESLSLAINIGGTPQFHTLHDADFSRHASFAFSESFRAHTPPNDLAQIFFAATLDALHKNGVESVSVEGDSTRKKPRFQYRSDPHGESSRLMYGPSFYSRYAQVLDQNYETPSPGMHKRIPKDLLISTRVTPPQFHRLQEVFSTDEEITTT